MNSNIVEKAKEKLTEYENRHNEILNAAIRLFNANGYPATTTASIAKEAGVNESTMYRHYKNKQVLFVECISSIVGELTDLWRSELEGNQDDSLHYLRAIASSYVNFVLKNPDKSMFLVHLYSYRGTPGIDEGFKEFIQARLDEAEKAITALKEQGVIRSKVHPRVLAGVFIGQYFTMVFLNEFVGPELFKVETIIELAQDFLRIENLEK